MMPRPCHFVTSPPLTATLSGALTGAPCPSIGAGRWAMARMPPPCRTKLPGHAFRTGAPNRTAPAHSGTSRNPSHGALEPKSSRLRTSNDQVERPCDTATFEALYQSRPLQPIVRRLRGRLAAGHAFAPTPPYPRQAQIPRRERPQQYSRRELDESYAHDQGHDLF
jgi:hypothetical protein